jgi:uridine kinase
VKSFLIGIAGLSGSGKSALARELATNLEAAVITLDSYYHPQTHLTLADRANLNYDHPDSLDWILLHQHLDSLTRGESIEEPRYLFDQHTRSSETRRVDPAPFLILEGILTLHRPEIRALLDLKIFVSTDGEECLRRRMERDVAERGRTRESVLDQYQRTVWPMALEYVLPSRDFAGLTVSGEQPIERSVESVLHSLRRASIKTA